MSAGAVFLVSTALQPSQRTPQIRIPGYVIETEIGRGGVATVYLAIQQSLDRKVALKVMSPALAAEPDFTDRFEREGRTVAQFSHPNIVTIYDVGVADYQHYIAMEYLSGGSLKRHLHRPLEVDFALNIVTEMAQALGYAHSQGYVHRDVKPENILFRNDGVAVLTDFGIAKSSDSHTQLTRSGTIVGTPRYMSPEQAQGDPATARSDIYALGVILYEMLTARPPFDTPESLAVLYSHINDPVPELPAGAADLQSLVDAMMTKDPQDRVPDCETLGEIVRMVQVDRANPARTKRTPRVPVRSVEQRRRDRATVTSAQQRVDADAITEEITITPTATRTATRTPRPPAGGRFFARIAWLGISGAVVASVAWYIFHADQFTAPVDSEPAVVQTPVDQSDLAVTPDEASVVVETAEVASTAPESTADGQSDSDAETEIAGATSVLAPVDEQTSEVAVSDSSEASAEVPSDAPDAVSGDEPVVDTTAEGNTVVVAESGNVVGEVVSSQILSNDALEAQTESETSPAVAKPEPATPAPTEPAVVEPEQAPAAVTANEAQPSTSTVIVEPENTQPQPETPSVSSTTQTVPTEQVQAPTPIIVDVAEVQGLLSTAEDFVSRDRLSHPPGDNAMELYRRVLEMDPGNGQAQVGLSNIANIYITRANEKFDAGDMAGAALDVERGRKALPDEPTLVSLGQRIKFTVEAAAAFAEAENYSNGINVDVDHARAFERYSEAAEKGHPDGPVAVAAAYANGVGTTRNEGQAIFWLKQAAERGHLEAQYLLGLGLIFGDNIDLETAAFWIQRAVEGGYERAYRVLGWMHQTGTGVERSPTEAIKWGFKGVVGSMRTADEPRRNVLAWEDRFKSVYDEAVSSSESATGPSGEETDSSK